MNHQNFIPKKIHLLLITILFVAGCGAETTTPASTSVSEVAVVTPTSTPRPSATPTNTSEPTSTSTNTPTNTPEPTATPTNTPTNTPEPTATPTDTPTSTPTSTDTPTPLPTNTPTPTVPPGPKAGHWEGENPSVSFDVTAEGVIRNFKLVVLVGPAFNQSSCTITLEEIVPDPNNTFIYETEPIPDKTAQPPHINGKFNDAITMIGEVSFELCGNLITMSISASGERTVPSWEWSANWTGE